MYGADPSTIRSGPRLAKSVPTGDINELIAKGEQFEIMKVYGRFTLDLSHKGLKNLGGMANIPGIETVQKLILSYNQLESLEGLPAALPALQQLYLHHNQLESLQGMPARLPALQDLNLHSNKLVSLQGMPAELPALQTLFLLNNQLSDEDKQKIKERYPFVRFLLPTLF
jgi:hypothetical protein